MIISKQGLAFIKDWEKFYPKAYLDLAGIWTIGYGTIRYPNGQKVTKNDEMTIGEAIAYLRIECDGIVSVINKYCNCDLNQNQIDALTSLAYNIGTQGLKRSTLLRVLNNNKEVIENYFTRWNKVTVDGELVSVRGLTRRRKSEYRLFRFGDYTGNSVSNANSTHNRIS